MKPRIARQNAKDQFIHRGTGWIYSRRHIPDALILQYYPKFVRSLQRRGGVGAANGAAAIRERYARQPRTTVRMNSQANRGFPLLFRSHTRVAMGSAFVMNEILLGRKARQPIPYTKYLHFEGASRLTVLRTKCMPEGRIQVEIRTTF